MSNQQKITCKACFAFGEKDVRVAQRELEYSDCEVLVKVECGGFAVPIFITISMAAPECQCLSILW